MDDVLQDLRQSFRMLWKSPGFTAAAVAALALGIGANTAIFSVVNSVLLRPLPYPDPERLVMFMNTSPQGSGPGASPTKFNVWRQLTSAFEDVSAYRATVVNLTGAGDPEQLPAAQVSSDFFKLFGAPVAAGRVFAADEDLPNGGSVVVLSEGFWKRRFGGDASIVGRSLAINGQSQVIVGVLGAFDPEIVQSPDGAPDVWLPFQIEPNSTMQGNYFVVSGRLRRGVTAAAADAALRQAANEFNEKFPNMLGPSGGFGIQSLREIAVRNVRSSLWVLVGAVAFVLLIACANVANLLLVRAAARKREIAVRAAIGAGRGRIVRQLLTESMVLSMLGGLIGLGLGTAGMRTLLAFNPGNIPRIGPDGSRVALDWRVLAFTAVVTIATGLVFGTVPALHASRPDLSATLKEAGRADGGFRRFRARGLLVVSEMTLALVLLIGAALLIRTFISLRAVDPGFDPRGVLTLRMSLTDARFAKTAAVGQLIRTASERLNALPGVEVAGATCCVPLQGGLGLPFTIEGRPLTNGPFHGGGAFTPVSYSYFAAFKIPVIRGRSFTDRDEGGAPGVVIINQTMARQYWPTGDPLNDRLSIAKGAGPQFADPPRQIVGVVGDVRNMALSLDPPPTMYIPWAQLPDLHNANLVGITPLTWIIRARGEPGAVNAAVQRELRQASGGLPVAPPRTMGEIVARSTAREDFNMLLLTTFAGVALLLAGIGIYGLMAYSVQQRTREIGIRVALGADAHRVRSLIVLQGMRIALVGVVLGLLSSFGLTRVLAGFLFGVGTRDPLVFVTAPILLTAVAFFGVWLPARRAARVDPAITLRME